MPLSAGRVVSDPTSTLNLNATFLDYADAPPVIEVQSRSLRPVLEEVPGASRDMVLSEWRLLA
jgi:hypothetical protein